MDNSEILFHNIAAGIPDAHEGKMFGALCVKAANGKAGVMYWHGDMIFKLSAAPMAEAMKKDGVQIFEPMAGRPMGGWVHIPAAHSASWAHYAVVAMDEAAKIVVPKKVRK